MLAYSTVGLKILRFPVGGTDTGDQAVVIISGRERLAEKLQGCPVMCQAGTERRLRQLGCQRHAPAPLIPEMGPRTHDQQRTGENYIVKHFVIYILRLILIGLVERQRRTEFLIENYVRRLVLSPVKDLADPYTTSVVGPGSMTLTMITFQNYQPNSTFWNLCVP